MNAELREYLDRREALLGRVRRLLIDVLQVSAEPDEIDPDTPLFGTGLALDSIDAVDLMIQLNVDFGLDIPSDREGRTALRTVNSVIDLALAKEVDGGGL